MPACQAKIPVCQAKVPGSKIDLATTLPYFLQAWASTTVQLHARQKLTGPAFSGARFRVSL
jgi:hypothetical protein